MPTSAAPTTEPSPSIRAGARAELRAWYLGRLRPRLVAAAEAGIVAPGAVEELDLQLAGLVEPMERRVTSAPQQG